MTLTYITSNDTDIESPIYSTLADAYRVNIDDMMDVLPIVNLTGYWNQRVIYGTMVSDTNRWRIWGGQTTVGAGVQTILDTIYGFVPTGITDLLVYIYADSTVTSANETITVSATGVASTVFSLLPAATAWQGPQTISCGPFYAGGYQQFDAVATHTIAATTNIWGIIILPKRF